MMRDPSPNPLPRDPSPPARGGKTTLPRRNLLALGAAAALAPLAGCGFQPVYMPTASGSAGPATRELAAIHVGIIPDRPGQLLRQALQVRFRGAGGEHSTLYDLSVVYWITGEGIGIQPDNSTTRIRLIGNANWTLIGRDPARSLITSGFARSLQSFAIFDQQFFNGDLETEQYDGRIADEIADQIALRLAAFFRQKAGTVASS